VATWKDLRGNLLWANPNYEPVTRKQRDDAFGHSAIENWPGELGQIIANHDATVRETKTPYLTVDRLAFGEEQGIRTEGMRLTVRFPILNSESELAMTATLGLDYGLLRQADKLFETVVNDGWIITALGEESIIISKS